MIDIENKIIETLTAALITSYPTIYVTTKREPVPTSFPAVSIREADNSTYVDSLDSSASENHADLMYEINVFSNKGAGAKAEAKAIMAIIDQELQALNFVRRMIDEIDNGDPSIHRRVARYSAIVGTDYMIYRR